MNQVFLDLIQTPSVVLPILIGLAVIILVAVLIRTRPDKNDYALADLRAEQEDKQESRIVEQRLKTLYETNELLSPIAAAQVLKGADPAVDGPATADVEPPQQRLDDLNRGADIPRSDDTSSQVTNTPYSDMAAKYGFDSYKHYASHELILFDSDFPTLDVAERVYTLPLDKVIHASGEQLRDLIRGKRRMMNSKAMKAGLPITRRKVGRPARMGVS